jgi:hypothetical protein
MKRKTGYYFVKPILPKSPGIPELFSIGFWSEVYGEWWMPGIKRAFHDDDFSVINTNIINTKTP